MCYCHIKGYLKITFGVFLLQENLLEFSDGTDKNTKILKLYWYTLAKSQLLQMIKSCSSYNLEVPTNKDLCLTDLAYSENINYEKNRNSTMFSQSKGQLIKGQMVIMLTSSQFIDWLSRRGI